MSTTKPILISRAASSTGMHMGTDVESQPMLESSEKEINIDSSGKPTELTPDEKSSKNDPNSSAITKTGLKVLALLAFQNCFKNILMRFVMVDHGGFLLSTAVIVVEILKLIFASSYIVFVNKQSVFSIITFIKGDMKNTILLAVPATSYSLQMTLEYVAFENLDPAFFSVLVQLKMLTTALFFRTVLKKRLMKKQIISLFLLTVGVMLCNMKIPDENNGIKEEVKGDQMVGILATLGIACSSGFASVYTEKVIKAARKNNPNTSSTNGGKSIQEEYGLAHMQAQLAIVSLVILGVYSCIKDLSVILEYGFFYNFNFAAFLSSLNSAVGGLIVAAVLKYANSVLKGYATAVSVVLTGVSSHILFGTELTMFYAMGIFNVVAAVLLYNSNDLDAYLC